MVYENGAIDRRVSAANDHIKATRDHLNLIFRTVKVTGDHFYPLVGRFADEMRVRNWSDGTIEQYAKDYRASWV